MKLANFEPWHFTMQGIAIIEDTHNAKYMGAWCIKDKNGNWSENPVEVFYQSNPDIEKGHTNYFGIFTKPDGSAFITNAESAFSEPINAILEDDIVYASKYRHDYVVTPKGSVIDGGRDYLRSGDLSSDATFIRIRVKDGEFIFS